MSDVGSQRRVVKLRRWVMALHALLPVGLLTAAAIAGVVAFGTRWAGPILGAWAVLTIGSAVVVVAGSPRITLTSTHLSWRAYRSGWSVPWESCGEFRATGVGIGKEVVVFDTTAPVRTGRVTAAAAREAKADMALGEGSEAWRLEGWSLRLHELADLLNFYRRHAPRTTD